MKQLQDLLKSKISDYEFQPLFDDSETEKGLTNFEFKDLNPNQVMDVEEHERVIKIERKTAKENNFTIAPIVREHRGMNRQEELERQRLIQEEVERQLIRIQDQAYKEGFEKGLKDGQEEVFQQMRAEVDQKVEALNALIEKVLLQQADLLQVEKENVHRTLKTLTKWIILRELKDDGDYILRLLEKLISELQVKSNVLVQLDPTSFEEMPDVLEALQEKLGELSNVRVEVDYDIPGRGVVVESDNGIINGSLEQQFLALSKLFEHVGLEVTEEDYSLPAEIEEEKKDEDES